MNIMSSQMLVGTRGRKDVARQVVRDIPLQISNLGQRMPVACNSFHSHLRTAGLKDDNVAFFNQCVSFQFTPIV
jgi:hypothetical protein